MNPWIFCLTIFMIYLVTTIIFFSMLYASKIGMFIIPILSGLAVSFIFDRGSILSIALSGVIIVLGINGALSCALGSYLFDLKREINNISKTCNSDTVNSD